MLKPGLQARVTYRNPHQGLKGRPSHSISTTIILFRAYRAKITTPKVLRISARVARLREGYPGFPARSTRPFRAQRGERSEYLPRQIPRPEISTGNH